MPDFDLDFDLEQWLLDNEYTNPGDISEDMGSWTGDELVVDGINEIWDTGMFHLFDAVGEADPVVTDMYEWALNFYNPDDGTWNINGTEFAEQLFMSLYNNASGDLQTDFVNVWNNNYADDDSVPQLTDPDSIQEAAEYWAGMYGGLFQGEEYFSSGSLAPDFATMLAGIEGAAATYNAEWGGDAWTEMTQMAQTGTSDYELQYDGIIQDYLNEVDGLEIQSGGIRSQYDILRDKELSEEAARGLRRKRRGLQDSNSINLQQLNNQLQQLDIAWDANVEQAEGSQELLMMQWEDYLTSMYDTWNADSAMDYETMMNTMDTFVD